MWTHLRRGLEFGGLKRLAAAAHPSMSPISPAAAAAGAAASAAPAADAAATRATAADAPPLHREAEAPAHYEASKGPTYYRSRRSSAAAAAAAKTAAAARAASRAAAEVATAAAAALEAAGSAGAEEEVWVELSDLDSEGETVALHARMQEHQQLLRRLGLLKRKRRSPAGIEPVDVEWLLGSDPRRGFDLLTLDEKAAFLSLRYLSMLSTGGLLGKEKNGGSAPLWRLSTLVGEDRIPRNILGPGALRVPPGFRCLTVGQLRVLGLHCSNSRMCIGEDEDKTQTATSLLLNDSRLEDRGSMLIDQVLALGGASQRNTALWTAWKHEYPVRVIRGHLARSQYAPEVGFRYDGLYRVVELLIDSAEPPESLCRDNRSSSPAAAARTAAAARAPAAAAPAAPAAAGSRHDSRKKGVRRGSAGREDVAIYFSDSEADEEDTEAPVLSLREARVGAADAADVAADDEAAEAAAATSEAPDVEEELLSYAQMKARNREAAAAAAANSGAAASPAAAAAAAAAAGRVGKQEERLLKGRCIFKFLLLSIHSKQYTPPTSRWESFALDDMSHPFWESDKKLKAMRQLAERQFAAHCRVQKQMAAGDDFSLQGTTTRVVEVYSDLPRPFALSIPPLIPVSPGGYSIASLASVAAAAYQVYGQLLEQWGSSCSDSSKSDPECCAAAALAAARSVGRDSWGPESSPAWAVHGFLPLVLEVDSFELELTPVSYAEKQRLADAYLQQVGSSKEAAAAAARKAPEVGRGKAAAAAATATGERWGGAGWEGWGGRMQRADEEGRRGAPKETLNGISSSSRRVLSPQENLERLLERIERRPFQLGHRTLRWNKRSARLIISRTHALQFAHSYLPQARPRPLSATCGLISTVRLTAPLPASWCPWADISQGQEVFPIPAINEVDPEPPPTDFCYQRRNVLFGRLPSSSMLCLCTGCVPRNVDTLNWERIELPSYCDALRDPVTGRIYCAGANPAFVKTFRPLASCSAHCLCSPSYCTNRLPEDLQFRVTVAKTRHAGWELRTAERIPKGAFVMQYVGEVIPRAVMDGRSRQEARKGYHNYCMEVVGEESDLEYDWAAPCIDSLFIGNVSRFLNHSCDPNVRVATIWRGPCLPLVGVFALKDIPAGAALTYAYGPGYEEMLCLCGAANCKGFIGGGAGDAGDKGLPICSVSLALRAGAPKAKSLRLKAAETQSA
ncbi:hypothetical protein Esti_002614 [Eimeria stiedai]